jgi:flagellar protein FliO/FliZ
MKAAVCASVIALTLAVGAVAAAAPEPAAETPASAPAAAPAAAGERPLALRSSQPLSLAPEPKGTPWPYKVAFAAVIGAAGYVAWRRRRASAASPTGAKATPELRVVARAPLGMRAEIAVVEVAGTRVLVGVTPSSIQTLAIVPEEDAADVEDRAAPDEAIRPRPSPSATPLQQAIERAFGRAPRRDEPTTGKRLALAARESAPEAPSAPVLARPRRRTSNDVEGQARGLLAAIEKTK